MIEVATITSNGKRVEWINPKYIVRIYKTPRGATKIVLDEVADEQSPLEGIGYSHNNTVVQVSETPEKLLELIDDYLLKFAP